MSKSIAGFALVAAIALIAPSLALAHVGLESATPAENTAVAVAPSVLNLRFSDVLNPRFTGVEVTSAQGTSIPLGESSLKNGQKTLVVPITAKLAPGTYTVTWHALSEDGHKTKGSYTFTVAP